MNTNTNTAARRTTPIAIVTRKGGKAIKRTAAERSMRITRYAFPSDGAAIDAFHEIRLNHPTGLDMVSAGAILTIVRY